MPQYYTPVPEYILSEEERTAIDDSWNGGARDLKTLIKEGIGDGYDGRSAQGKAVKKHLATQNQEARPIQKYIKKSEQVIDFKTIESSLSDNQKEFIANNWRDMDYLEMAKTISNNPELQIGDQFYKDCLAFIVKLGGGGKGGNSISEYVPPKTLESALRKVKRHATMDIDENSMTPRFIDGVSRLIRYLGSHKFIFEINNLKKQAERDYFESSFIKYTYSKPDLTEEEVDSYMEICSDRVNYERMKIEEATLVEEGERSRQEDGKMHMAVVEALGKLRTTMTQNRARIEKALNTLNGTRSDRLKSGGITNLTISDLIQIAREADKRKAFLTQVKNRKELVQDEARRLSGMDGLYFELFGASQEELVG